MNLGEGKADLVDADEIEEGVFEREVPEGEEDAARTAAESCPVDAITIVEEGEEVV